jgi:hypothetical protein
MQDPKTLVVQSAISEVFLRRLAKQGFVKYDEGSEFVDTRDDLVEMGDAEGGGLKEMDEKLKTRVENLKDLGVIHLEVAHLVSMLTCGSTVPLWQHRRSSIPNTSRRNPWSCSCISSTEYHEFHVWIRIGQCKSTSVQGLCACLKVRLSCLVAHFAY